MAFTNLRVSDVADLRNEAQLFQSHADDIRKITGEMLSLIDSTMDRWRGEAHDKYTSQFAGLQDDMDRLYQMCSTYSTDLMEIANNYENAENDNVATAQATQSDIVMA